MHLVASTSSKRNGIQDENIADSVYGRDIVGWLIEWLAVLCGGLRVGGVRGVVPRMLVLETLVIGPKKQLVLVSCEGEKYLIATGPETVQAIQRVESRPVQRSLDTPEFGERS